MQTRRLDSSRPVSKPHVVSNHLATGIAAVAVAFLGMACEDDDPAGTAPPSATIENIWPHDDGRSWLFSIQNVASDSIEGGIYAQAGDVPPARSPASVPAALDAPLPPPTTSAEGSYRLRFEGMKTTHSGATGQNLTDSLIAPPTLQAAGELAPASRLAPARFLSVLARVRPDLAPRIRPFCGLEATSAATLEAPLFLFGAAWEQTASYIGTYGDVDTLLAWKYLEADLQVGHEFTFQLVPRLADDVYLHARVVEKRTAQTSAGTFLAAIVVAYVVDYGISTVWDETQTALGFFRAQTYGTVTFAPTIGPVGCRERYTGYPEVFPDGSNGIETTDAQLITTAPGGP